MKKILVTFLLITSTYIHLKAEYLTDSRLISYIGELQCLNSQELGLGASYFSGSPFNSLGVEMSNLFNLRHKTGDFIYCNRIQANRTFVLFTGGISINNYTDFKGYALTIGPVIGFGFETFFRVSYSYNFECIRNSLNKTNVHCISLQYWISTPKTWNRIRSPIYY